MPNSPNFSFPYPGLTDAPDGPAQIGALANAVDSVLATQVNNLVVSIATLANPPRAQLRQIVAQSIPNITWTALSFTAEDHDSHNGHDNVTNNTRYTAPISGVYEVAGSYWFAANATGVRFSRWMKDGTILVGSGTEYQAVSDSGAQSGYPAKTYQVSMNAGQYLELAVWHNRGSALNTYVGSGSDEAQSTFTVKLIRNNNF